MWSTGERAGHVTVIWQTVANSSVIVTKLSGVRSKRHIVELVARPSISQKNLTQTNTITRGGDFLGEEDGVAVRMKGRAAELGPLPGLEAQMLSFPHHRLFIELCFHLSHTGTPLHASAASRIAHFKCVIMLLWCGRKGGSRVIHSS